MVLSSLVGDRDRAIDQVERAMPRDASRVGADFLADAVAVRVRFVRPSRIVLDLEVPHGQPDREHVRVRRQQIAQSIDAAIAEVGVAIGVLVRLTGLQREVRHVRRRGSGGRDGEA